MLPPLAPTFRPFGPGLFAICLLAGSSRVGAVTELSVVAEPIDFSRQIQPILSENCYLCHGPDSSSRKPKRRPMRLDRAEFAFAPRKDGEPVIIKGNPGISLLYERIMDAFEPMPPEDSHKVLKPEQKEIIRRWIEQGAEYKEHWSFIAVEKPCPPESVFEEWARNPIDAFIGRRLEGVGLKPNEDQEPRALVRRLAFDLTGLPPNQELVERFARQPSDENYRAVVNELLASPAYAEHWARHWLDAVRYADTHGIHIDNYRSIWPYRDWVIRAFGDNMPFDQFTIEQLAGDMVPDASRAQRVASGFNRCLATTSEGGAIDEEYLAIYAKDRVDTTFAVWQGLTTGCASCHDHKFDPISQKDFYSLTAFFRNNTMRAMDGNYAYPEPIEFVPRVGDEERWAETGEALQKLLAELDVKIEATGVVTAPQTEEREEPEIGDDDEVGPIGEATAAADVFVEPDLLPETVPGPPRAPGFRADLHELLVLWLPLENGVLAGTFDGAPWEPEDLEPESLHSGIRGRAVDLNGIRETIGASPRIDPAKGFSVAGWFYFGNSRAKVPIVGQRVGGLSWTLELQFGRFGVLLRQGEDQSTSIFDLNSVPANTWNHVAISLLPGSTTQGPGRENPRLRIYVNGQERRTRTTFDFEGKPFRGAFAFGADASPELFLGAHESVDDEEGKENKHPLYVQHLAVFDRVLGSVAFSEIAGALPAGVLGDAEPAMVLNRDQQRLAAFHVMRERDAGYPPLAAALEETESAHLDLRDRGDFTLVMAENVDSEPTAHILNRGDYSQPGEEVPAEIPGVFGALPQGLPRNRTGLARWLVSAGNPLTARVTMNRYWYYLFGAGIVETTEDLGIMGARPSHPDLLDWLAAELVESGWDLHHMLRLLVTSSAYRQSPVTTPEKANVDPDNTFVSRGPRSRLEAEQLRDLVLHASGLLVDDIGGPSVRPYQPEGVWDAVAMKQSDTRFYEQGRGDELYRRSLYTLWKRTAPPPSMEILNAPSREVFCVRREMTNTPIQALVTLNDPQFVEACRVLAAEALDSGRPYSSRLDHITLRLLNRTFNRDEREVLIGNHRQIIDYYKQHVDEARELLAVGEAPVPEKCDPAELAAWTLIASQVLNFDETLTK